MCRGVLLRVTLLASGFLIGMPSTRLQIRCALPADVLIRISQLNNTVIFS